MSEPSAAERLETLLAPFTADKPGLAALVTVGGETVFERYLGGADLEHGAPVTAATRFHVASVSKQFTALAVLMEARAGRVDLAADIHTYLPELADYGAAVPTVSDLVHHTSGLRDQWELMMLSGTPIEGLIRQDAIVAMAARQRALNFPPGTDVRYSNTGYSLMAEIVARTSGKPFAQYLDEAVFAPLGMSQTLVYGDASRLLPDRAMSYRVDPQGEVRLVRLNYSNYGATSLATTPRDLTRWARELMHPSVLDAGLIAEMTTPGALRDGTPITYGFGVMRTELSGRPALTHSGGDAGYRAMFDCYPDDDVSVVVMSNGAADVMAISTALAECFVPGAEAAPAPAARDPAAFERLAGYYECGWGPGFTLSVREGKLMLRGGGPPTEVKFLPNGEFYPFSPTYRFTPRPDGDLDETQGVGGLVLRHRRVERASPAEADLAALAGRYYSDEIDTTYELAVKDGALTLTTLRFAPMKLRPAGPDAFDGMIGQLTVVRDANGAVSGFSISTPRIRALPFEKVG